mgnify:CR=1 FL=1
MSKWLVLLVVATALTGCSLYRPDLQQGDYITQAELDDLKPNLSKHEVQQIIGTPALTPVFELEEWHYTYAFQNGKERDEPLKYKTITLYFKNGKLDSYSSQDWHPAHLPQHKK